MLVHWQKVQAALQAADQPRVMDARVRRAAPGGEYTTIQSAAILPRATLSSYDGETRQAIENHVGFSQ